MKTQKDFDELCKAMVNVLAYHQIDLDGPFGEELLKAMFSPSPERERDIEPGLLENEKAYPPDPERWVECIEHYITESERGQNITLENEYFVLYSWDKAYLICDDRGDYVPVIKKYFKPIPKP